VAKKPKGAADSRERISDPNDEATAAKAKKRAPTDDVHHASESLPEPGNTSAELAPDDPDGLYPDDVVAPHGLREVANRTIQALLTLTSGDDTSASDERTRVSDDAHDTGPVTASIPIVSVPTTEVRGSGRGVRSGKRRSVGVMAKISAAPDALAILLQRLSDRGVELRTVIGIPGEENGSRLELVVTAPASLNDEDIATLLSGLTTDVRIRPWASPTVEDMISAIIDLSTAVVSHPEVLDDMLVTLLSAQGAEHTAPLLGADDSRDVMRVQLSPDDHLVLRRSWAPFESVDRQRASALLRLAAAAQRARGDNSSGRLTRIKSGEQLWFRLARPEDADRLAMMHERSSGESLYLRYHGAAELGDVALRRLSGGHRGATIVAMNPDGLLVAAGHVFPLEEDVAELALMVEDDYQNRGVGAELLTELLDMADSLGFTRVRADVIGENYPMLRLLGETGLKWKKHIDNGVIEHEAWLDGRAPLASTATAAPASD